MPKSQADATHDELNVQLDQIGSQRPPSTIRTIAIDDVERSWKAWLVTLGSFMFLVPSFGRFWSRSTNLSRALTAM